MLISVHLPKCGGTSFIQILQNFYGDKLLLDYGIDWAVRNRKSLFMTAETCCIHGHFMADKYDHIQNKKLITWVRNPAQRVISHYFYFLRNPQLIDNPSCRAIHENKLSLLEFAKIDMMRNRMSYFLAGKKYSAFDFVGIIEFYKESLDIFYKLIGASPSLGIPHENINPNKTSQYNISEEEINTILEINKLDLAFYLEALDGFHSKKQ